MPEDKEDLPEYLWRGARLGEDGRGCGIDFVVYRLRGVLHILQTLSGCSPADVHDTWTNQVKHCPHRVTKEHIRHYLQDMGNIPREYMQEIEERIALHSL